MVILSLLFLTSATHCHTAAVVELVHLKTRGLLVEALCHEHQSRFIVSYDVPVFHRVIDKTSFAYNIRSRNCTK